MRMVKQLIAVTGMAVVLATTATTSMAQGGGQGGPGGNFDPAQMRQRMMERMREQFDVKDDAEWKIIEERLTKVTEARQGMGGGMAGMFGRGGQGGGRRQAGDAAAADAGANGGRRRGGGFGGEPSAEATALQKAIDDKAPSDEIKAKLAKYRDSLKAKQVLLEKAQEDLRAVLSPRQEAVAVLMGLLK